MQEEENLADRDPTPQPIPVAADNLVLVVIPRTAPAIVAILVLVVTRGPTETWSIIQDILSLRACLDSIEREEEMPCKLPKDVLDPPRNGEADRYLPLPEILLLENARILLFL
jgi:hypothetical protein